MAKSLPPIEPLPIPKHDPATDKDAARVARMEEVIVARASDFDLGALLDALQSIGYQDDDIEFRSHATQVHQSTVVMAVAFVRSGRPRAIVTLNISLLGPQSLLPSYFQRVMDRQQDGSLASFLNFFAHRLLRSSAQGQFPERDATLFADWGHTLSQLRSCLGVRALSTIHWVFSHLYPELGVSVKRTSMMRAVRSREVRVGAWAIGDGAVLGAVAQVPVAGVAVKLLSDELLTGSGQPWARAASERLHQQIFPLLARHGLHLEVSLILRDQKSYMLLRPNQFLGFVPLHSGDVKKPPLRSARTILLWSDEVPND